MCGRGDGLNPILQARFCRIVLFDLILLVVEATVEKKINMHKVLDNYEDHRKALSYTMG